MKPKKDGKSALDPLPGVIRARIGRNWGLKLARRGKEKKEKNLHHLATSNNLMNIIQITSGCIPNLVCIQTAARAA